MLLNSHVCTYHPSLIMMICVPGLLVSHQLVSLVKGYFFALWFCFHHIFGFCTFWFDCFCISFIVSSSWSPWSFHIMVCLDWGNLRGMVLIIVFFYLWVSQISSLHILNMFFSFGKYGALGWYRFLVDHLASFLYWSLWDSCVMLGQSLHVFLSQSYGILGKRPWCSL